MCLEEAESLNMIEVNFINKNVCIYIYICITVVTGPFPEVKRPGCGVDHLPRLAPRLRKVYSYTSTPSVGLRGLL